jgi:hypothetical protein
MNKILKTGISLLLFTPLFLSCETVEDVDLPRSEKPTVDISTTSVSVLEGGSATITITTNKPIAKPMQFKLYQTGGSAETEVDYEFAEYSAADYGPIGGRIVIPAYATTGSVEISGLEDFAVDGKTATFELRSSEAKNGVVGASNKLSLTVEDSQSDDLTIILSWATNDEDAYHADEQDLDFYIRDSSNNLFGSNGIYTAATGNFPEVSVLSNEWPDGTYYIDVDYWAPEDFSFPGDPALFTMEHILTIGKAGTFSTVVKNNYSDADAVTSEYLQWSGYSSFGGDGYKAAVATIEKVGNTYTIKDSSGNVVASGRFSTLKSPRIGFDRGLTLD